MESTLTLRKHRLLEIFLVPKPQADKTIFRPLRVLPTSHSQFQPYFQAIDLPVKKETPFSWREKQEKAFTTLKDVLCSAPIFQYQIFQNRS